MMMEEQNWFRNAIGNVVRIAPLAGGQHRPGAGRPRHRAGDGRAAGAGRAAQSGEISQARETSMHESIFLPFGLMMLMFMTIFLAAQPMLESVLEEKSQRIAEVLLGSVNAMQLMAGKLLGGLGGSLTVVATYASGALAVAWYFDALHLVPLRIVPWFLVYQVLAVMLFGSLFMAVGAACNQLKEAQSMLMPIWLVMVFPLFVWLQVVRDPTGSFGTWLSFIPPATPLLMVLRMGATTAVPWWQPALGIVVMLAATWLCIFAAARCSASAFWPKARHPSWANCFAGRCGGKTRRWTCRPTPSNPWSKNSARRPSRSRSLHASVVNRGAFGSTVRCGTRRWAAIRSSRPIRSTFCGCRPTAATRWRCWPHAWPSCRQRPSPVCRRFKGRGRLVRLRTGPQFGDAARGGHRRVPGAGAGRGSV